MEERKEIIPTNNEQPASLPPLASIDEIKQAEEEAEAAKRLTFDEAHLPYIGYGELAADYCEALASAYNVHTDFISACMLLVVGAAAGKRHTLHYGAYINKPCIWLCIAARKGYNKSTPLSQVLAPLRVINESLIEQHIADCKAWQAAGGTNSGKEPPPRKKILISDSTPEERYSLLANNDVLYYRDEMFGALKDVGRYSASGEIELYLSIHSGQDFSVERKTVGSYYVKSPFMAWVGTIQKDLLPEAFGSMALRGNGFLDRWLFVWLTDDKVSEDVEERLLPADLVNKWNDRIQEIWRMPPTDYHLTHKAKEVYQEYQRECRHIMNDERASSDLIGHLAKAEYHVLRICLCIHLLIYGNEAPAIIDADIMERAVRTCKAFTWMHWKVLQRITGEEQRQALSDADLIREFVQRFSISNQSQLARCIGRTQQYVNKILNNK